MATKELGKDIEGIMHVSIISPLLLLFETFGAYVFDADLMNP